MEQWAGAASRRGAEALLPWPAGASLAALQTIAQGKRGWQAWRFCISGIGRTSFRLAKFIARGYQIGNTVERYLREHLADDIVIFKGAPFTSFMRHQILNKGTRPEDYFNTLRTVSARHACAEALQALLDQYAATHSNKTVPLE